MHLGCTLDVLVMVTTENPNLPSPLCLKWWFILSASFCGSSRAYSCSSMALYSFFTFNFKTVFLFEASAIASWTCRNPHLNQPTENKVIIKINFQSGYISKNSVEPGTAWHHYNSLLKTLKHIEVQNASVQILGVKFYPNNSSTQKCATSTERLSPSEIKYLCCCWCTYFLQANYIITWS